MQVDREPLFQQRCVQEAMAYVRNAWEACRAAQKQQLPMLTSMLCDELASMLEKVTLHTNHYDVQVELFCPV